TPRMRAMVVDGAGTGEYETRLRSMRVHGRYQVLSSFQITLPYEADILGAKDRGKVDDVGYAIHRLGECRWIKQITLHALHSLRHLFTLAYERSAVHPSVHKAWEKPRAYEPGCTRYQ